MENEKRIGVYICHCGLNIAGTVDVEEVAKYAATLPHVVISCYNRCVCLNPGREFIKSNAKESKLNQVVVFPCSR